MRKALPSHMVRTTAAVAFHGRKSRSVERPPRRGRSRGKTIRTSCTRAGTSNMTEAATILWQAIDPIPISAKLSNRDMGNSRSISGLLSSGFSSWGTQLEYGQRLRKSSTAWRRRYEAGDKPRIHDRVDDSCSRGAALRCSFLQCGRL